MKVALLSANHAMQGGKKEKENQIEWKRNEIFVSSMYFLLS